MGSATLQTARKLIKCITAPVLFLSEGIKPNIMLNTTNIKLGSNSQEVNFNTTSTGHLQKSNPKSIFIKFQLGSKMADWIFSTKEPPYLQTKEDYPYGKKEITVLQTLIFGDNWFLCEIIFNEALEKINSHYR